MQFTGTHEDCRLATVSKPLDALLEVLNSTGGTLLDIGCGDGVITEGLSVAGFEVTGVEPSREESGGYPRVCASAGGLPFANSVFDTVLFHWSLHHVPLRQLDQAVVSACRVLKPTGVLCVVEPEPEGEWHDVVASFHDERESQAMALTAIERVTSGYFKRHSRRYYWSEDIYPDFNAFASYMSSLKYNHYTRDDVWAPAVALAFEKCGKDGEYHLRQRIRMDLFEQMKGNGMTG